MITRRDFFNRALITTAALASTGALVAGSLTLWPHPKTPPSYNVQWQQKWNTHGKHTVDTILVVTHQDGTPIWVDSVYYHFNQYDPVYGSEHPVAQLLREFRAFIDANPIYEPAYNTAWATGSELYLE